MWTVTVGIEERLNSWPFYNITRNGTVKSAAIRLINFSRRYSINTAIPINNIRRVCPVGAAEHMIPERAGHAEASWLFDVVVNRMPAFSPLQPSAVDVTMVYRVMRDCVHQISR